MAQEQIDKYLTERDSTEDNDQPDDDNKNDQADVFEYWPGNRLAIVIFLQVRRHWDRAGLNGQATGLQPDAVFTMMTKHNKANDLDLFEGVMAVADGVLDARGARD